MRAIDAEYAGRDEFELVDELEKLSGCRSECGQGDP